MTTRAQLATLAAALLTAVAVQAQSPQAGPADPMMGMHGGMGPHGCMDGQHAMQGQAGRWSPTRLQAMMDRRHAALKAQLKLTPEQEPAWKTFIEATKVPAGLSTQRPDPAELAKLSTPERIDRMKAVHAQRIGEMTAAMDKHGEAVKAFYAVLTPEQQKVFDAQHQPGARHHHGPRPAPKQG